MLAVAKEVSENYVIEPGREVQNPRPDLDSLETRRNRLPTESWPSVPSWSSGHGPKPIASRTLSAARAASSLTWTTV